MCSVWQESLNRRKTEGHSGTSTTRQPLWNLCHFLFIIPGQVVLVRVGALRTVLRCVVLEDVQGVGGCSSAGWASGGCNACGGSDGGSGGRGCSGGGCGGCGG
ncbi:hypothetical protein SCLCIDRAFT_870327 [Scleroderma citrinum Foug A]|uniref:Uncharacterized protein n=1 Tax=Scleroderma citrinum Foug A TaxID=1036808 RepID=A0A0C3DZ04_9AGAM|nr:hypothetical protein SCLCIDRAFT_870327 [Scleroderma citrinum Foug A]